MLPAGTLTKSHSQGKFSDAEIEATIKAKLAKSKIGKEGFQVHVKDGVATWAGTTSIMQHKGAATRMAKTAGATKVVNNIKVSEQETAKAASNLRGATPQASTTGQASTSGQAAESAPAVAPRHVAVKPTGAK